MGNAESKNASLEPFSGQEQTNCSKTQTGLRAIPGDVPEVERKKKKITAATITSFCKETSIKNYYNNVSSWRSSSRIFAFREEVLEPNRRKKVKDEC